MVLELREIGIYHSSGYLKGYCINFAIVILHLLHGYGEKVMSYLTSSLFFDVHSIPPTKSLPDFRAGESREVGLDLGKSANDWVGVLFHAQSSIIIIPLLLCSNPMDCALYWSEADAHACLPKILLTG